MTECIRNVALHATQMTNRLTVMNALYKNKKQKKADESVPVMKLTSIPSVNF